MLQTVSHPVTHLSFGELRSYLKFSRVVSSLNFFTFLIICLPLKLLPVSGRCEWACALRLGAALLLERFWFRAYALIFPKWKILLIPFLNFYTCDLWKMKWGVKLPNFILPSSVLICSGISHKDEWWNHMFLYDI